MSVADQASPAVAFRGTVVILLMGNFDIDTGDDVRLSGTEVS